MLEYLCSYLFHIILQSLRFQQLLDQCYHFILSLLDIFQTLPLKDISHALGNQLKVHCKTHLFLGFRLLCDQLRQQCFLLIIIKLYIIDEWMMIDPTCTLLLFLWNSLQLQWIVPKLVACCVSSDFSKARDGGLNLSTFLLALVYQLTMDIDHSLHDYIRVCGLFFQSMSNVTTFTQDDMCGEYYESLIYSLFILNLKMTFFALMVAILDHKKKFDTSCF